MTRTILLADDSVTIQKVIELTFMDDDYRVIAASNGDEALVKLEHGRPDIVIADIHMPGTNGYGVAKKAKERWPGVPVLLLVGTFEPFDEAEAQACGADGHMKKPFDSQELQRRVEELVGSGGASAAPVAPPPAEETLPPPPESIGTYEEETPRRAGFDFHWESSPAAPVVPASSDDAARTVFTPTLADLGRAEAPPVARAFEPEPEIEVELPPVAAPIPVVPVVEAPAEPAPVAASPTPDGAFLSDEDVDRIARRVVDLLGDKPVRDVAWEVVPDLAEVVIRERLRQLEAQVD
jgi:CheY-like chemotaxis protein